jgi:hypothetical protein
MTKLVLTAAQQEQFESMVDEGRSTKEIRKFFKDSYDIEIPYWKFQSLKRRKKSPVKKEKVKTLKVKDIVETKEQVDTNVLRNHVQILDLLQDEVIALLLTITTQRKFLEEFLKRNS